MFRYLKISSLLILFSLFIFGLCLSTGFVFAHYWSFFSQDLTGFLVMFGITLSVFTVLTYSIIFFLRTQISAYIRTFLKSQQSGNRTQNAVEIDNPIIAELKTFTERYQIKTQELQMRNDYRRDFIGNVAHELKTPLFSIQGYVLSLLDGAMEDPAILEKFLLRTQKNVERLEHIIKDLDLITKLEAKTIELDKTLFDLSELVTQVIDMLEIQAGQRNISLEKVFRVEESYQVYADKQRIEQVLINLISNSIKYGKDGGRTQISIAPFKEKIMIEISDNGIGISASKIDRIFERFYRVDNSGDRKKGGSGLGLSIVKHIVEAHQERIYASSTPETGSKFHFYLPKKN